MPYSARMLLERGFLPAELPPIFDSTLLGGCVSDFSSGIDGLITPAKDAGLRFLPTQFNLARQGFLRRQLQVPHPILYGGLCAMVETHTQLIEAQLALSPWTKSMPVPIGPGAKQGARALERPLRDEKIVEAHAEVRATSRYLVTTDISQFYHSIYTHSIGWMLGGKEKAKVYARARDKSKLKSDPGFAGTVAGDALDKALRLLQDDQSKGFPIGPDVSLLLAEALLSKLDRQLDDELKNAGLKVVAMRNMDDYQLGTTSQSDAEQVLALIQSRLRSELELSLNPLKTRIVALPEPLEAPWVTQLKGIFREGATSARQKRRDLLRLFDLAVAARLQFPEAHVFGYLLGILKQIDIEMPNWPLLESLLLQMALAESGALRQLLPDLLWYQQVKGVSLTKQRWSQVLGEVILRHAPQEHSSEVAWALWALRELELTPDSSVVAALAQMEDPFCCLLALALGDPAIGLLSPTSMAMLKQAYQPRMTLEHFWGSSWMLVYEGARQGWLQAGPSLTSDPGFGVLWGKNVGFCQLQRRVDPHTALKQAYSA